MSPHTPRLRLIAVVPAVVSLLMVGSWVFFSPRLTALPAAVRSADRGPAWPIETDADGPRPDHPGEAVLFRRLSLQDEKGNIPLDGLTRGVEHARAMQTAQTTRALGRSTWTWLGPGNIGGRIRSIVIAPTNPGRLWIGSVSGGIWTTSNGGATWQVVDDFMANLAVSTLILNPVTPSIMYAGTGEGFYNSDGIQGAGVFKSIDGGTLWTQLPATANANWTYVNRLAISPNGAIVLAATRSGLWRSLDAGSSWSKVLITETLDAKLNPISSTHAIASGRNGGAWYSTNSGATWTPATGITVSVGGGRVELAYAPGNPAIVYASVDSNSGEVWKSVNGGQTYTFVSGGTQYLGSQGWYDNALWVDPTNANTLIVGGIDLWRSINGGATLARISQWQSAPSSSAHADHHAIVNDPNFNGNTNKQVYFGNDGGIYRATEIYAVTTISGWQALNNNLGITQFYGAAGNATSGVIVGGTQDNGTPRYSGGTETWTPMFGGDGGFNAADPTNSNYFYGEYVYLNIHRSANAGLSSDYISGQYWNGSAWVWKSPPYVITDSQTYHANFIAPFVIDPNNADRLLGGGWSLWRTNDAKTTNTSSAGPTWATIKPPDGTSNPISAIAIAPGNSSLIWVGHNNGDVFVTANGTLITPTWTRVDTHTVALPNRFVTRLTIDPQDAQIVYATFGGFSPDNVWRTTNGGATWADLTGSGLTGLPDTPVRSLVVNPNHSNWLYVGTEVGIFASEAGGATWGVPQDGPANVSVDELFWLNNGTLVAATHGRGLYKADFGVALSAKSRHTEAPGNGNGALDPGETLAIQVGLTNGGAQTATGITGTLRLIAGSATALTGTVAYPNLNAGATQTNTTPFAFNINPEQACGEPLTFVLSATYNLTRTFAHTFSVPIGAPTLGVTATYTATDLPQAIPDYDPAGVNSSIVIAAPGAIGDVDARVVSVTHTWDSDLVFRLSHSSGAQAYLINQRGSNSDNFVNTLLDDSAATPIVSGTAPFTGRFRPEEPLSAFNGQPLSGTWTLNLSDQATGDTGILNSWALDIRPINYTCAIYLPTPTVQLSPNAITVGEGDGAATITATLSGAAAVTVTVDYATTNGTATAPADYAAASGTLTFTPGVTQAAFNVAIVNDALIENAETFGVTLSNPISATLGAPSSASVTISDNDQPGVALSSATYSANESAGVVPITVTLNQAAPYVVTVAYATSNGTAIAPGDYASATGTVTFTPGVTQSTFNVAIVNEALVENSEIFNVTLSNPSGATLGAPTSTTITIIDNDLPAVQFSSAAYAVAENSGSQPITVTLEQAAPFTVTVVYATSNGTATAPGDYVAATDTLTFTPGVTQLAFSVSIVNDALIENNETFSVTLSNPGSATLGSPASALVTIVDDDQPQIQFSAATYAASESSSTALITVTLDQPAAITVTVHFATSDGTATAGSDYTLTSGTLTIIPGLSAATFSVPILDDAQFEAPEALNLTLSAPINATLGALTQATLSISDNDFGLFLPLVIKE